MADEDKSSVAEAVKALESIKGVNKFVDAKLAGGKKSSFDGGIISVLKSSGKIRVEYV